MNEQQLTQELLGAMIKVMGKMAGVLANCENRIKAVEEDDDAENAASLELLAMIEALSAQFDTTIPVEPTL